MVLSSGTVNNPVNDAGIIIERGNVENVGLIWVHDGILGTCWSGVGRVYAVECRQGVNDELMW